MHNNDFDFVEEIEQDIDVKTEESKQNELKEYEKLLLAEANREVFKKAVNLINAGCFDQKQETSFDFSKYEEVKVEKKFKGIYDLYRNLDTMQLVFVLPLVENNKGDVDERKDLAPYAYDCIYIETMDDETYQMVMAAAKNNISTYVDGWYLASTILYWAFIAISGVFLIVTIFFLSNSSDTFGNKLFWYLFYCATYFLGVSVATTLKVLTAIKYKKYKDK